MLDGQGPVGASLPMRAAALIADDSTDRLGARERVEAALELERGRWPAPRSSDAAELAGWVEESVRRILREAALGELGADLNEAADETLIATGLEAATPRSPSPKTSPSPQPEPHPTFPAPCRLFASRNKNRHAPLSEEEHDRTRTPASSSRSRPRTRSGSPPRDWLEEVEEDARSRSRGTLDFPAIDGDLEHRERIDTPRVRHLFPVPEDADWEVKELKYDHYGRAG